MTLGGNGRMTRFCWRERTERVNWRMLRNLHLADVVRRGDATLLEPYALHLTFAKLPVVLSALVPSTHDVFHDDGGGGGGGARGVQSDDHNRNAWFLVRVFQLAMEYLFFLRARDGAVVDSLREELQVRERESELLAERAKKWKDRSKSGDRQVDKLHHVLQSIAKLLQIEGATPNAVTTIESLLRELVPSGTTTNKRRGDGSDRHELAPRRVDEARVCVLCGKMFSSQEFLEKHLIRRHPGSENMDINARMEPRRPAASSSSSKRRDNNTAEGNLPSAAAAGNATFEMKEMLRVVEKTLQDHQETLRTVAQEEADKIHNLYEQLHAETQLAEHMRATRMEVQKQVEQSRHELEQVQHEKDDTLEEIRLLKEQQQFLTLRNKIEAQNGVGRRANSGSSDATLALELQRLEETISMLKDALAASREELTCLQDSHGLVLKEKLALESKLHEAQNHTMRLEAVLRGAQEVVPLRKNDFGAQTSSAVLVASCSVQTDDPVILPPSDTVAAAPAIVRVRADEVAVQTDEQVHTERVDSMVQTDFDPLSSDPPQQQPPQPNDPPSSDQLPATARLDDGDDESQTTKDTIFRGFCLSITDVIDRRALKAAHTAISDRNDAPSDKVKPFQSLPRRKYLRSRFLHDERAVKERITSYVAKLEQTSQRYGIPAKSVALASEHVDIVQRALHGHLEVLPAEVLQRMIDIENVANTLIKTQWMPQEKSRQQALERLTAQLELKSQVNQGLVRQAMVTFASTDAPQTATTTIVSTSTATPVPKPAEIVRVQDDALLPAPVVSTAGFNSRQQETVDPQPHRENAAVSAPPPLVVAINVSSEPLVATSTPASIPPILEEPATGLANPTTATALPPTDGSAEIEQATAPPSPKSVQGIRKQAVAVRSVKVVSVSPKKSPAKPPSPSPPSPPQATHSQEETTHADFDIPELPANLDRGEEGVPARLPVRVEAAAPTEEDSTPPSQVVVMKRQGPGSFSARYPESQLGIVIPSRYEHRSSSEFVVVDSMDTDDKSFIAGKDNGGPSSEYSHDLRWSASSGGRGAVGAGASSSQRSFSNMASSEMSFDASIPSLASEGSVQSSMEDLPSAQSRPPPAEVVDVPRESEETHDEIQGFRSIREEGSDSDDDEGKEAAAPRRDVPIASSSSAAAQEPRHSPRASSPVAQDIMAFDDDSDIEEVMLA